jgi:rubrerythrin
MRLPSIRTALQGGEAVKYICPVCARGVKTNRGGVNIAYHRDKADRPCPTSGYPIRITITELLGL